ncbi:MAG: hypothetical protein JNL92_04670 [Opitutaceae bacterium]|nr:hypothetical protein [Opitutaceae bacterium]
MSSNLTSPTIFPDAHRDDSMREPEIGTSVPELEPKGREDREDADLHGFPIFPAFLF